MQDEVEAFLLTLKGTDVIAWGKAARPRPHDNAAAAIRSLKGSNDASFVPFRDRHCRRVAHVRMLPTLLPFVPFRDVAEKDYFP